jgi:hypothetical protein
LTTLIWVPLLKVGSEGAIAIAHFLGALLFEKA